MQECGYLYIAVNPQYVDEAVRSAKSIKKVDEHAHITLITNKSIQCAAFDHVKICEGTVFSRVEMFSYRLKHIYHASPYNKTFYIDTDVFFYDRCTEAFKILDYFDIGMVAAPRDRKSPRINGEPLTGCIPTNCGVVLYCKNEKNELLFNDWQAIYENKILTKDFLPFEWDQTAFMEALIRSESRLCTLPNTYNAVSVFPLSLNGLVKIVHQRSDDYEALERKINCIPALRCWDPHQQRCIYKQLSLVQAVKNKIKSGLSRFRSNKLS